MNRLKKSKQKKIGKEMNGHVPLMFITKEKKG